jgi:hypothetical protein
MLWRGSGRSFSSRSDAINPLPSSGSVRKHAVLRALTLLALVNLCWLQPAAARLRFTDTAEQIARADFIVVGRTVSVAQGAPARIKLKIERSIMGGASGTLQLDPSDWLVDWPAGKTCESLVSAKAYAAAQAGRAVVIGGTSNVLTCGARRTFFLTVMPSSKPARNPVITLSRVGTARRAEIAGLQTAIQRLPKWRTTAFGLAVILLPKIDAWPDAQGLSLRFGIRNVSDHPIQLHYGGNRRAQRSFVALDIVDRRGKHVAGLPLPYVDAKDMQEFFVLFGASKPIWLAPGEYFFQGLDRITQAQAGGGYKDELDFQYYPLAPGRYRVVARGLNYITGAELTTAPIEIRVE